MAMQRGAIEVWTARPDVVGAAACGTLGAVLDGEERERAAAFRFDIDRDAFVLAHALRRMALGTALGADPSELRFGTAAHGRPVLLDAPDAPAFSLTRSRGLVACAIGRVARIGIDVETVSADVPLSVLDPFVVALQGERDPPDFFLQWTALEAYWKAQGTGLSAANPRIALRLFAGDDCYEVIDEATQMPVGTVVLRLPAPAGLALALASDELGDVRLVQLDGIAPRPAAQEHGPLSMCKERHCGEAPASSIVDP
jgi:phosphopantetheinyl transferase